MDNGDFFKHLLKNKVIDMPIYNYIMNKSLIMERLKVDPGSLLILYRLVEEPTVIKYYNEFFNTDLKPILDLKVTKEIKDLYENTKPLVPLSYENGILEVTGRSEDLATYTRQINLRMQVKEVRPVRSLLVSFLLTVLKITGKSDDAILSKFTPKEKADLIILDAIRNNATDVHIDAVPLEMKNVGEGFRYEYPVRFKIASELEPWTRYKLDAEDNQKIIYNLVQRARNGNLSAIGTPRGVEEQITDLLGDGKYGARLKVSQCIGGYTAVMRIHQSNRIAMEIQQLGFSKFNTKQLLDIANRERGLCLVTGKTGSGKNTTVYAMLNWISHHKNLLIHEFSHPVEALIPHAVQKNYKEAEDLYEMVAGLKKEDPDIVFLGEIADKKIADIIKEAVDSNIRIFTTTHLDRVWDTPQKLFDYYQDDYKNVLGNMDSVINQVIFQKLCPHCRKKIINPTNEEFELMSKLGVSTAYTVNKSGCPLCRRGVSRDIFPQVEILRFTDVLLAKLMQFKTPLEMQMYLKKYVKKNNLGIEYQIKDFVEEGLIDIHQVKRRGLCE